MATIGLRDLHVSDMMEDAVTGVPTYETPNSWKDIISAGIVVETVSGQLHTDDALSEDVVEFSKGTLTINTKDLTQEQAKSILSQQLDGKGVTIANGDDKPTYKAVGWRSKMPGAGNNFEYLWLYKVKFAVPSSDYTTKGGSIEFKTPTITGTIFLRKDNRDWKALKVLDEASDEAKAWFSKVYEKTAATPATPPAG